METKYLYVFEAKEIQKFILQSDKLKEMIGGSEIVSQLCNEFLKDALAKLGIDENDHNIIANAAGWARIIFNDETKMKTFFAHWPFLAAQFAPGLQIIQGVEAFANDAMIPKTLDAVNIQLRRERNRIVRSLPELTPLIERNPRTGLAATTLSDAEKESDKKAKLFDRQSLRKLSYTGENLSITSTIKTGSTQKWPEKFDDIVDDENAYLAIIHADGNDLGSTLIKLKEHVKNPDVIAIDIFKQFSEVISEATVNSAQIAFDTVLKPATEAREGKKKNLIPARPIVLGGDDLTIVVRADLAFDFTTRFLAEFEAQSAILLKKKLNDVVGLPKKLTACAGISFVKKTYPFVHGYELAESLCGYTKLMAKGKKYKVPGDGTNKYIPSSLTFHRNTSSLAGNYGEVREKELTSRDRKIKLWFGPYAVAAETGGLPAYTNLKALAEALRRFPGGSLRTLIADLYLDEHLAKTRFDRMRQVAKPDARKDLEDALKLLLHGTSTTPYLDDNKATPLFDAHTLNGLIRATEEENDDNR